MLYSFFIDRPIFALVVSLVITLAGGLALSSLPIAQYPQISPPTVSVSASYPGASAEVVEQTVAAPIEEQVNGADGMTYMSSTSTNAGSYSLSITFDVSRDLDLATVDVQNRMQMAEARLPGDVRSGGVVVNKQSPDMLMAVNVFSPDVSRDDLFLTNYAKINLVDALSRIQGIGKVDVFGSGSFAMRIWLDPQRMAALGLTVSDIVNAVNQQNIQAPAGRVGAPPAPAGAPFELTMRVKGRLVEVQEFRDIIVKSAVADQSGGFVRLKDVAEVELGAGSYANFSRLNGKPSTTMLIYQQPGANALQVAKGVREAMAEHAGFFPTGVDYTIAYDTTLFVENSIQEVVITLLEAIGLVFLVVWLFLQNWRATVIPMVAVPVSLVGTMVFFPVLGFTLNTLTLFGLVLAIGVVVDDAIVVVESAQRNIDEKGMGPRKATLEAMREVAGPCVANSLVLIAVFVPVAFLGGITGQLYKQFALTLSVSVAISTFNALTLSPALSALMLRPAGGGRGPLAWFFGGFNRLLGGLTRGYTATVRAAMRRWLVGLAVLLVLFGATYKLFGMIPSGFVPDEDQGYFVVNVSLPPAASQQRTDQALRKVEAYLAQAEGVADYITLGGFSMLGGSGSNSAVVFVVLEPWEKRLPRGLGLATVMSRARGAFFAVEDGLVMAFSPPAMPGLGSLGGFQMQLQDRGGLGLEAMAKAAAGLMAAANKRPEVAGAFSSFSLDVPQLELFVDREKAIRLGVPLSDVFTTLQSQLGGLYINDFNRFGRTYEVMLQAAPEYRTRPEDVNRLFVKNLSGDMVPLSTLTRIEDATGPEFIQRYNVFRSVQINGQAAPGYSSGQAIAAMEAVAQEVLPQGFGYEWTGSALQEKKSGGQAGPVFGLALLMVFLCLAALYESWAIPFAVLLALPLGVFGAFAGQMVRGLENNVYAQIGLVMLVGLAAKNAVLIVEYAKAKHEEGLSVWDAALEAAELRFRPILMTALSFILGVTPLVVATGAGAAARRSLGTSVFAGMLAATAFGVLFIPLLYYLVMRATGAKGGGAKGAGTDAEPETTRAEQPPAPA